MRSFRERNPVTLGLAGTAVLALIAAGTFYFDELPVVGSGETYQAEFAETAGLEPDNEVRVAGIKVGEVSDVDLDGDRVQVSFTVDDAWIGNETSAEIKIKTVLGQKYLALNPGGNAEHDPDAPIPLDRTVTPFDVTDALEGLAATVGAIDTDQLAESFTTMSETFSDSPEHVHTALDGLSALSTTIAERDQQLSQLLSNSRQISDRLAESSDDFDQLIEDGNLLLTELHDRREAISALLSGSRALGDQLSGLVADNEEQLGPALDRLDEVTDILRAQADNIDESLDTAGPYFRVVNNSLGSGRWIDNYLCGLIEDNRDPCTPPRLSGGE